MAHLANQKLIIQPLEGLQQLLHILDNKYVSEFALKNIICACLYRRVISILKNNAI